MTEEKASSLSWMLYSYTIQLTYWLSFPAISCLSMCECPTLTEIRLTKMPKSSWERVRMQFNSSEQKVIWATCVDLARWVESSFEENNILYCFISAHKDIHSPQVKQHRETVLDFIADYLKSSRFSQNNTCVYVFCKISFCCCDQISRIIFRNSFPYVGQLKSKFSSEKGGVCARSLKAVVQLSLRGRSFCGQWAGGDLVIWNWVVIKQTNKKAF